MAEYGLGVAHGSIVITYDGAGVAKAQGAVAGLEARTKASGLTMARVGKGMAKSGAVIAAGLALAVHQAATFQSKMNLLVSAAGESPKALGKVSEGIKNIAIDTGTSLDDLADGMYQVEKAGFRGAGGLHVLQAAAEGARAENVDMATFTNALTSVMTSYSYKATDAVKVTNMMVAAAGRSKTTMQEFAGSLATVLPIASALGISFPQVAGAMSVLTQHGTSARESTQELANLIRNLAGQNNVAKAAMEQLGVPVINLQRNLGKRGLSGSLEIVTKALAKHGRAGMIVTSALKQTATGQEALNTMIGKMPKPLAEASKQFSSGKMSMKDYRSTFKGLGGQASVMGQQFLGAYSNANGFSNALKSGNPRVATLAATLQKALGGATGMRTALQLGVGTMDESSASAKLLHDNIKGITEEGDKNGKHISTWARTQHNASVQFGRLRAAGEVFAVNLGNTVLPAIVGVVKILTSLVTTFASLPAPIRKVIGSGLLMAAGFLLIGSLLIKLVTFGQRFVGVMRLMSSGIVTAVRTMLERLGLLTSVEARAVIAAEESAAAQVAATERVAAAKAALAEAATKAQYAVARAELAEAEAAQESATVVARAEAEKAAAYQMSADAAVRSSVVTGEAAAAGAAGRTAAGAGGIAPVGARSGMKMSGAGLGLGAAAFFGGGFIKDGNGGARDQAGTVVQYAGAGAMLGSFAGPQGAAIGAGIGAIVGGLKDILGASEADRAASKRYAEQAKADSAESASAQQDYNGVLRETGGLIDKNVRALVSQRLAQQGILDLTDKVGANRYDVTSAVLGNKGAIDRVITALDHGVKVHAITTAQHDKIERQMGIETEALTKQNRLRQQANDATDKNWDLHQKVGKAIKQNGKELALSFDSPELQAMDARVKKSGNKPGKEQRDVLAYNTTGLLNSTSIGASNNEKMLTDHIKHLQDLASQQLKTGKTGEQASAWYDKQASALQRTAIKAGLSKDAVHLFFRIMSHPPKDVEAKVKADTKNALQRVYDLNQRIKRIKQGKVPHLNANSAEGRAKIAELQRRINNLHQKFGVPLHVNADPARAEMDSFSSWFSGYINTLSSKATITPHVASVPGILTTGGNAGVNSNGGKSSGGWVPGPSNRAWPGAVHGREYVLSTDMLRGRRKIDARVLRMLSAGQVSAMRRGAYGLPTVPSGSLTPAQGATIVAGGGSKPHRIVSGSLEISRDSMGELRAHVQDMIAEEHDFNSSLAGMS